MRRLPAEFEEQSFIQVIFPHLDSDWEEYLQDAEENFVEIINAITSVQDCLVICDDVHHVSTLLKKSKHLHLIQESTNDTWARDCSCISVYEDEKLLLLDYEFNAWGGKFDADLDNQLSKNIANVYNAPMITMEFILEGGAIESNGQGTLLLTKECVFNTNRNALSQDEVIKRLKEDLGVNNILILNHGYLAGDDTDSHIDTLARFIDKDTIVYLECTDTKDEHYLELLAMKKELQGFVDEKGNPFNLVALPFTKAIFDEEERLPSTYANFLILNESVLVPTYKDENDDEALEILEDIFKGRRIVPIDCSTLIRQHGSLHCVTMQFPSSLSLKL